MKLKLFYFIDACVKLYESNQNVYNDSNLKLIEFFIKNYQYKDDSITSVFSRIKSLDSFREKLFRNKFYLKYDNTNDVINNMNDIIGLTIECRFIKDESNIYKRLLNEFKLSNNGFYKSEYDENVFLNLNMPQPQLQRNGFPIYRIDGFYMIENKKVNFELQIKAMVHSFWSEIEHQVVYKNTKLGVFNALATKILASIRDNLDVVDSQLEIIYNQIMGSKNEDKLIGITPESFKMVTATSINELVSESMLKSIKVATDFKECSAILSQFIYITQFLNAENPSFKMIDYFEHLNFLKMSDLDFTQEIIIEKYESNDIFCKILGEYWLKVINIDYDWHVFFIMCFALQTHDSITSFNMFINTIKNLVLPPSIINSCFETFSEEEKSKIIYFIKEQTATSLVEINKLKIVYERHLFDIASELKKLIKDMENRYKTFDEFIPEEKVISDYIKFRINQCFN